MKKIFLFALILGFLTACEAQKVHSVNLGQPMVDVMEADNFQFCKPTPVNYWPIFNTSQPWQRGPTNGEDGSVIALDKPVISHYHVVFVGIDLSDNANRLKELATATKSYFIGVNIDFAYKINPVNLDITVTADGATLSNETDFYSLAKEINTSYPLDGIVFVSEKNFRSATPVAKQFSVVSIDQVNAANVAAHEIGHLLGLWDGYQYSYPEAFIPNGELFFLDKIPPELTQAINQLNETPPLYIRGWCNGNAVYSLYDPEKDLMVKPGDPNARFTPLQVILMNDYVAERSK